MNLTATPVFTVHPDPAAPGRWLVCRPAAGRPGAFDAVESCPTLAAAERECAWQQAEHERDHRAYLTDRTHRGTHRPHGARP